MCLSLQAPASKSVSHRAAIAAALAPGRSFLHNILQSQDLERTLHCLQALGASIEADQDPAAIQGMQQEQTAGPTSSPVQLDVGESGTTCRLLTPIAALQSRPVQISGRGRMHERPIAELARSLEYLGCSFTWLQNQGYPPFIIQGHNLQGGSTEISLEQSSQYLSGLLLMAPALPRGLEIAVQGQKAVSWPYVALTIKVMQDFGCPMRILSLDQNQDWRETSLEQLQDIQPGRIMFQVPPGQYQAQEYQVEGDWSNASYLLATGLFLPRGILVQGLDPRSGQGDRVFLDILEKMGAKIRYAGSGLQVMPGVLQGARLDMGDCPDLVPTVAVLASLARGQTQINNVAHLRLKESDRLQALAQEIEKTACQVHLMPDGLVLDPGQKLEQGSKINFSTYSDHRLAMSLSLYELAGLQVILDDPQCVHKSYPDFWLAWAKIKQEQHVGNTENT